jgi:hypothetical protein
MHTTNHGSFLAKYHVSFGMGFDIAGPAWSVPGL